MAKEKGTAGRGVAPPPTTIYGLTWLLGVEFYHRWGGPGLAFYCVLLVISAGAAYGGFRVITKADNSRAPTSASTNVSDNEGQVVALGSGNQFAGAVEITQNVQHYENSRSVTIKFRPVDSRQKLGRIAVSYIHPETNQKESPESSDGKFVVGGVPRSDTEFTIDEISIDPRLKVHPRNSDMTTDMRAYVPVDRSGAPLAGPPFAFEIINDTVSIVVDDVFIELATRPTRERVLIDLASKGFAEVDLNSGTLVRAASLVKLSITNKTTHPLCVFAYDVGQAFHPTVDQGAALAGGTSPGANLRHFESTNEVTKEYDRFAEDFPNSSGWFAVYIVDLSQARETVYFSEVVNFYGDANATAMPQMILTPRNASKGQSPIKVEYHNCEIFGGEK